MRVFEDKILPASAPLQRDVVCIRMVRYEGNAGVANHVALSGLPGIIFQHHNGHTPIDHIERPSARNFNVPTLYVHGQITEPSVMHHKAQPYTLTQIILKPHAIRTIFGVNAVALTNRAVELSEFAAHHLHEQLLNAVDEAARITLITDYLVARREQAHTRDLLIEESLRLIHHNPGTVTVKQLREQLHISERHFERRFRDNVGVSPQFYLRVKRFNAAMRLMQRKQHARLADVAQALHYYDESHLIREVKAFSGTTPKFLAQRADEFQPGQTELEWGK